MVPEVPFRISSELNVREAFSMYADRLGYQIQTSREPCPDYELLVQDGAPMGTPGEVLGVEAEKRASDFNDHGHDVDEDGVDFILCWRDDLGEAAPAPVLALEEYITADDTLGYPDVTLARYRSNDLQKRFVGRNTERGDEYQLLWEDLQETQTIESNSPSLTTRELQSLLELLPEDIRRAAFVEGRYDRLETWARTRFGDERITNGYNIAEIKTSDGGRIAFRLNGTDAHFRIQHWHSNNTHTTQKPVNLSPKEFTSLFQDLPLDVRESVFGDLDMEALSEYRSKQAI